MQAIPRIEAAARPAVSIAGGAELQKREEIFRWQRHISLRRKLAQSVIPSGGKSAGLHHDVHGGPALTQSSSDRAISAQGGNKTACIVIHTKSRNAKYLDRQGFKRWSKA
jgi:hypothetical protein